jgi:predicted nucleic acid-binding protein
MKVLLDTNIIIHREASKVINQDIGVLFNWIDKLKYSKFIHPATVEELNRNLDPNTVATMGIKIASYNLIRNIAPTSEALETVGKQVDITPNDENDTKILNEVFCDRVDILISEDKKIHTKAKLLGISDRVFKIDQFLEKVTAENPELVDYKVLAVKQVDFAQVNLQDIFFDSFREDYNGFDKWFNKKADETAYVCYSNDILSAFLYIKVEDENENYSDIEPSFKKKKRLKIGTLKVASNGFKVGERFLKIIFDNALQYNVTEIYVTIFNKRGEQQRLIVLLEEWGFSNHGTKVSSNGNELVYIKPFSKKNEVNIVNPKLTFPFISRDTDKYIIRIEHQYHTELFPDSIHTREDKSKYTDNEPHRNRLSKVYISHAPDRNLKPGDIILIYHIGETIPKRFSSTVTTICIVESIKTNFKDFDDFYNSCNRKTMISKEDLESKWWNKFKNYRPFIINLLAAHSFPTPKPTLNDLVTLGIVKDIMNMPKGFMRIDTNEFDKLLNFVYNK